MAAEACPSIRWTTFTEAPEAMARDAAVCRNSCGVSPSRPPGVDDDAAQFLTAAQVDVLTTSTPWPYSAMVHVAAWAGLRAAELAGLQVGDVELPAAVVNQTPRPGRDCCGLSGRSW